MSKGLALFDFDGTITRKDTFLVFIRYCAGSPRFLSGFLMLAPVLVLYKLKLIPNWRAKEIVFSYFFKGVSSSTFESQGLNFAKEVIPSIIRPSALQAIKDHLAASDRVVIVTASSASWIKGWSETFGIELLTTDWAEHNGTLTGRLAGKNCYGIEKRNRVVEKINLKEYSSISVYGDTRGDREMLELGTRKFYRHFID